MKTGVKQIKETTVKRKLDDILLMVTWSKIARQYFGKSSSWIYNKLNGRYGNGGDGEFTEEEVVHLKGSLVDFADRIRRCADTL